MKRIRFHRTRYTFSRHSLLLPHLRTMVSPSAPSTFAVNFEAVLLALCLCRRRAFIVPLGANNQSIN